MLAVYVAAMIASVIYWRRCPTSCLLTLLATGGLFALTIGQSVLYAYLVHARQDLALGVNLGDLLTVIGIFANFLYAGATILLLIAVFHGRRVPAPPWTENTGPGQDRVA